MPPRILQNDTLLHVGDNHCGDHWGRNMAIFVYKCGKHISGAIDLAASYNNSGSSIVTGGRRSPAGSVLGFWSLGRYIEPTQGQVSSLLSSSNITKKSLV